MYLDDILMFFKNRNSHINYIKKMLRRLRKNDFFVYFEKYFFFKHEIDYLKFIINKNDIAMNSNRIDIIMSWSLIKSFKNIQIFLNFVNFHQRFIARFFWDQRIFIKYVKKMQANMKKESFLLTNKKKKTFDLLKKVFQYALI
jgi:hypothetical protein